MRRTPRALIAVVLTVLVGGLAGCSSGDSTATTGTADAGTPDGSFCSLLIAFRATNQSFEAEFNSGDPSRTEAVMTEMVSQADLLRRKAPADIKADVTVVAGYITSLDALLGDHGYDVDGFVGNEEASAAFLALTTVDVDSSLLQLRTYAETTCLPVDVTSTTAAGSSTTVAG